MTSKIIEFRPKKPPDDCPGFAEIEIEIGDSGAYSIKRTGARTPLTDQRLAEAVRAMQIQILSMARNSGD